MKFDLSDFLQLDTKGLLAVNGGSPCGGSSSYSGGGGNSNDGGSPGGSGSSSYSGSSGGSGGGSCSGGNSGSNKKSSGGNVYPTKYGPTSPGWWGPTAWSDGSYLDSNGNRVYPNSNKGQTSGGGGSCSSVSGNGSNSATGTVTAGNETSSTTTMNVEGSTSTSKGQGSSTTSSNPGGNSSTNPDSKKNNGNNAGELNDTNTERTAYQKLLDSIIANGDKTGINDKDFAPGEKQGCYIVGTYQCDDYVENIVKSAGFTPEDYSIDNSSGKSVDKHIEDLMASKKTYYTDASKLTEGAYVVFMSDKEKEFASHAALLFVEAGGDAFLYDNSSRNFTNNDGTYAGGIEKTFGTSAKNLCDKFSGYENFYFQKF